MHKSQFFLFLVGSFLFSYCLFSPKRINLMQVIFYFFVTLLVLICEHFAVSKCCFPALLTCSFFSPSWS